MSVIISINQALLDFFFYFFHGLLIPLLYLLSSIPFAVPFVNQYANNATTKEDNKHANRLP